MDDESKTTSAPEDELSVEYANNVTIEPTVWDMKLIFGEFSQRAGGVQWHTSITLPWAQAKLLAYYLQANIIAHEGQAGKVKVPGTLPEWPAPPEIPNSDKIFEALQKLRQQFIDNNPKD